MQCTGDTFYCGLIAPLTVIPRCHYSITVSCILVLPLHHYHYSARMHTYTHAHAHTNARAYTHTRARTHTHTHTHAHTSTGKLWPGECAADARHMYVRLLLLAYQSGVAGFPRLELILALTPLSNLYCGFIVVLFLSP